MLLRISKGLRTDLLSFSAAMLIAAASVAAVGVLSIPKAAHASTPDCTNEEIALALAEGLEEAAFDVWSEAVMDLLECEINTPGSCSVEEAAASYAEDIYDSAVEVRTEKEQELTECLAGP